MNGFQTRNGGHLSVKRLGQIQPYALSDNALKQNGHFVRFTRTLTSEEYCERNPAQIWLNHSRFAANRQYQRQSHEEENSLAFTELQWSYIMATVTALAEASPELHQKLVYF